MYTAQRQNSWARKMTLVIFIICAVFLQGSTSFRLREKRNVIYPSGSIMQLSIGVSIDSSSEFVILHTNLGFQQNVPLPTNITQLREGEQVLRTAREARREGISKNLQPFYSLLESEMGRYGFNGSECLQKSICEMELSTFNNEGILEDILNSILKPHLEGEKANEDRYMRARAIGAEAYSNATADRQCENHFPLCPVSPFSMIARVIQSEQPQ